LRVHPPTHVDRIAKASERGGTRLDPDTVTNAASWDAAARAAGGTVLATDLAVDGAGHGFAAVRPPGHHAEASRAMGFCLLNNVVVGARHALSAGVARVLIVDWDVHHGNGTQALVDQDPAIRFISLHQWPWYPGTGAAAERGVGNVWNLPRAPGLAREHYVGDLLAAIDEASTGWPPELVLVSAGFDSMAGDPLGGFTLAAQDYAVVTTRLIELGAPVVAILEGGYDLSNLVEGVEATVSALSG
jgi:acetoin utilization deacetylase AcuC-like enzyme